MNQIHYQGACFCNSVRYRISGAASSVCVCHCQSCRRATGAPFVAWLTCAVTDFSLTVGELSRYHSSPKVTRGFCDKCGTTLTYAHDGRALEIDVSLTTLDEATAPEPTRHIWIKDKLSWVVLNDGLPQYDGWASNG